MADMARARWALLGAASVVFVRSNGPPLTSDERLHALSDLVQVTRRLAAIDAATFIAALFQHSRQPIPEVAHDHHRRPARHPYG